MNPDISTTNITAIYYSSLLKGRYCQTRLKHTHALSDKIQLYMCL